MWAGLGFATQTIDPAPPFYHIIFSFIGKRCCLILEDNEQYKGIEIPDSFVPSKTWVCWQGLCRHSTGPSAHWNTWIGVEAHPQKKKIENLKIRNYIYIYWRFKHVLKHVQASSDRKGGQLSPPRADKLWSNWCSHGWKEYTSKRHRRRSDTLALHCNQKPGVWQCLTALLSASTTENAVPPVQAIARIHQSHLKPEYSFITKDFSRSDCEPRTAMKCRT